MKFVVTGASGYIGQRLIRAARTTGHEVLALSRYPIECQSRLTWQPFDLADITPLSLPQNTNVVFHLAVQTQQKAGTEQIELAAAQRLMDAARTVGARFVFVSSQTARVDAPTEYGRIKWKIERATLVAGGWVIRPGQVYGGPERGLFGELCTLVRHLPILPTFLPAPIVQPIHIDDLVTALLSCTKRAPPSSVLCIASPQGVGFSAFLQAIACGRTRRWLLHVPIPVLLIRWSMRILGSSLNSRFGLDRLNSLFALPQMETTGDLQRLLLSLRPLSIGMTRSGQGHRALFLEAYVLLTYVLRMKPTSALVRRYVKVVKTLRTGRALCLPELVQRVPALLALLDGAQCINAAFRNELGWRLNAALMLAEASPQGSRRFLGIDRPAGFLRSGLRITLAIMMEASRRTGQIVFRPFLARVGCQNTLT